VRFVSKGRYRIARVVECVEDPQNELALQLQVSGVAALSALC
jgi:hypothetical protein